MRSVVASVASIGLALWVGACGAVVNEVRFDRDGIGTDLYRTEFADEANLQDLYLKYLCRLAAPGTGLAERCAEATFTASDWPLIVQAGFNDIDRRCDEFLSWIEYRKRTDKSLLSVIGSGIATTTTILGATATADRSIELVGAALGFAKAAFTQYTERLITVAEKSTVQSVVLTEQTRYREELIAKRAVFDNRPAAIHALRNYLRICMPMTIETKINSTVTIFQQAGATALHDKDKLISTEAVGRPTVPAVPVTPRQPAGQIPDRPQPVAIKAFEQIVLNYTPTEFPVSTVRHMQNAMCVPVNEVGNVGETTKLHIAIFEASDMREAIDNKFVKPDGKLDLDERQILRKHSRCPRAVVKNFYERILFIDGKAPNIREIVNRQVINRLNRVALAGQPDLPDDTRLPNVRTRIKAVRAELMKSPDTAKKLIALPDSMSDQWTPDLFNLLSELPEKRSQ